jgi:hypothetical protein
MWRATSSSGFQSDVVQRLDLWRFRQAFAHHDAVLGIDPVLRGRVGFRPPLEILGFDHVDQERAIVSLHDVRLFCAYRFVAKRFAHFIDARIELREPRTKSSLFLRTDTTDGNLKHDPASKNVPITRNSVKPRSPVQDKQASQVRRDRHFPKCTDIRAAGISARHPPQCGAENSTGNPQQLAHKLAQVTPSPPDAQHAEVCKRVRPDVPLAKYVGSLKVSKRRVQIVVRERLSGRSHFRVECRPQLRVHDGPG